jgi:hypothetical protein
LASGNEKTHLSFRNHHSKWKLIGADQRSLINPSGKLLLAHQRSTENVETHCSLSRVVGSGGVSGYPDVSSHGAKIQAKTGLPIIANLG